VFARPDRPKLSNGGTVSDDGRWLVVTSSEGTDDRYDITLIDLTKPGPAPRPYVTGLQNNWSYIGNQGDTFYWVTNKGAPRLKIVATDINRSPDQAREIVPEDAATLGDASIVGRQLIASYLVDAKTEVRTFDLTGQAHGRGKLPGIGTAGGFSGDADDSETFYAFSSFNMPTTIYRYDSATGQTSVFAQPKVAFSPGRLYGQPEVLPFQGRDAGAHVRRAPPRSRYAQAASNLALRLWRLQRVDAARLFGDADRLDGARRRIRARQHPRRRRIWQGVA
jgi:prolyl oligopeptidase